MSSVMTEFCECSDPGCRAHKGHSECDNRATSIGFRHDMEDETGTLFCDECAQDAGESGLFEFSSEPLGSSEGSQQLKEMR
jgi:hypothetical protein